jgi:hypothetical protein
MGGILKQILIGIVGGSLIVHCSGLWRPISRLAGDASYFSGLSDSQQLALALSTLIVLSSEPLIYMFSTSKAIEVWGLSGVVLLSPLALTHLLSWIIPSVRRWPYRFLP